MQKRKIVLIAFVAFNIWGMDYATGPIISSQNAIGASSSSKKMMPSSGSNQTGIQTNDMQKTRSVTKRKIDIQNTMDRLINFSRKASLDLNREIKKNRARKDTAKSNSEIKAAKEMANKYDKYAAELQRKKNSLTNDKRNTVKTLQTLSEMSQSLQMQLQDAMNKQTQTMQIIRSIMKSQHDTLKAIIQNMK